MTEDEKLQLLTNIIRRKLRDFPELNELWPEDFGDTEIKENILLALWDFNGDLPTTNYTARDFPDPSLLLDMSVMKCMETLINWHSRNVNSSSDQGVQVVIHERAQYLQPIVDRMKNETNDRKRRKKAEINLRRGWGGVGSPARWY